MDIPSVRIPTINIPGTKLFSGFSFPPNFSNTTWFIIVFVLGMFLLSCMSNRCGPMEYFEDPLNRFEHVHYDGPMPPSGCGHGRDCTCLLGLHDDKANPLDYSPYGYRGTHGISKHHGILERFSQDVDDNGRSFQQPAYSSCNLKTHCLPGELDTGKYCIKEGCPSGFEQGVGIGSDFCYPTCAPGYESDGTSRCFKVCPEGYITEGDRCRRPKHEYKKDVIPCKGCLPPTLPTPQPEIPMIDYSNGPVWMNPPIVGPTIVQTEITHPVKKTNGHTHTTTTITQPVEYFNNNLNNDFNPQPIIDNIDSEPMRKEHFKPVGVNQNIDSYHGDNCDPCQTNDVAVIEHMANKEMTAKAGTEKKKTWRVEDRIFVNELPCPLGYSQSGNMCYESCPPQYEDTGDSCVLHSYTVPRPSYNRGNGVPYSTKRSKYKNISPVMQCK